MAGKISSSFHICFPPRLLDKEAATFFLSNRNASEGETS